MAELKEVGDHRLLGMELLDAVGHLEPAAGMHDPEIGRAGGVELVDVLRVAGVVDGVVADGDLEGRGEVDQVGIVVRERGLDCHVLQVERLLGAREAARHALGEVGAVVVVEVGDDGLAGAVNGVEEAVAVVVVVVVRDESEVEDRLEARRLPVVNVDGEERLRRLHDDAHVVYEPDGGLVRHCGRLDLSEDLVEGLVVALQTGEGGVCGEPVGVGEFHARQLEGRVVFRRDGVELLLEGGEVCLLLGTYGKAGGREARGADEMSA